MATRTRNELIVYIAEQLKIAAAGQPLEPEDRTVIDSRIDPANDLLAAKEVAFIGDLDNIPGAWFTPFGDYCCMSCARALGVTGQDMLEIVSLAQQGQRDLYALARSANSHQVLRVENFNGYGGRW